MSGDERQRERMSPRRQRGDGRSCDSLQPPGLVQIGRQALPAPVLSSRHSMASPHSSSLVQLAPAARVLVQDGELPLESQ